MTTALLVSLFLLHAAAALAVIRILYKWIFRNAREYVAAAERG
ncbi:MAG TPA: hypothetical protein VKR31_18040 [Rhizomicrobium sp.]|nr:hypothetical protein [Rhizomicrobium sp.]